MVVWAQELFALTFWLTKLSLRPTLRVADFNLIWFMDTLTFYLFSIVSATLLEIYDTGLLFQHEAIYRYLNLVAS